MKKFTGKNGFPLIAALVFYIFAGAFALVLFSRGSSHLPWQVSPTQNSALYDIRPELNATTAQKEESAAEQIAEPFAEPSAASEPTPAEEEETTAEEIHYYAFTTTNQYTILRVREKPDINSKIIYRLFPGSTGYVLERGDSWSLIQTPEATGYSHNDYLDFQEVSEEEYLVW